MSGEMVESFSIEIDRKTAKAVMDAIQMLGEHISAGVPVPPVDEEFNGMVGAFYETLRRKVASVN
ncbi:hypothetical protein ACFV4P_21960 [Kitasatospora sp. NPDC059795]|uniref:hypothetical protein n=1 Tax=Kitasatospora sp. NPDC059795 TaxID=3346949 RepID=UPI003667294A